jgi:hypothetical protein
VISSEPLTKDESAWKLVPRNHLLVVTNSQRTVIEPIHLRTLYSSSDSVGTPLLRSSSFFFVLLRSSFQLREVVCAVVRVRW